MPELEVKILRQGDEVLFPKLFFNRPVNPIQQPIIVFVEDVLSSLSWMHETATALGSHPESVAVLRQKTADAATSGVKLLQISDVAGFREVLDSAQSNASFLNLRLQTNLTSQLQISLSSFLLTADLPILLGGSCWQLFANEPALLQKTNLILALDTGSCLKLINVLKIPVHTSGQRGAYQLVDLAQAILGNHPNLHLMIYDHSSVIWAENCNNQLMVGLWHGGENLADILDYVFGATAAMLAYPLRSLNDFCERALNGAYLVQTSLNEHSQIAAQLRKNYSAVIQ